MVKEKLMEKYDWQQRTALLLRHFYSLLTIFQFTNTPMCQLPRYVDMLRHIPHGNWLTGTLTHQHLIKVL